MLAAIAAPVECSALRADAVRSICIALQSSVLIVARIWIVWSLILTIRVGIQLRTVSRFRDHLLYHYRAPSDINRIAAAPKSVNFFIMVLHVVEGIQPLRFRK